MHMRISNLSTAYDVLHHIYVGFFGIGFLGDNTVSFNRASHSGLGIICCLYRIVGPLMSYEALWPFFFFSF